MPQVAISRLIILALCIGLMVTTRFHHFAVFPDASWAAFFIAGFFLHAQMRWVFPLMMVVAVLVDYLVISAAGMDFWSHYCVSPGYWFLLPAHFAMWLGGALLARIDRGPAWRRLGAAALAVIAAASLCHLFAQGGFYWLSSTVAEPSLAGWAKNYADWWWAYTSASAMYVMLAVVLKLGVEIVRSTPLTSGGLKG